jgi:hypothetical protein
MRKAKFAALFTLLCSSIANASSAEVDALAVRIEAPLKAARYMEGSCAPIQFSGWEGYETIRCTYSVTDKETLARKTGLVVMLNPSARKLSQWIISACQNIRPNQRLSSCTRRVVDRIFGQSGGQFPIAGVVYEDLLPRDGIYEAYGFFSGVTTVLEGVKHRRTQAFSSQELEKALTAKPLRTVSEEAYARITGVTRAQFQAANPTAKVTGMDWPETVRKEYQRAWNSDRNSLIEAWLASTPP